jgi:hypothetical protein
VNVEREVKLRATEGFLLPNLNVDGLRVTSSHEDRTVTTYVDTRDQRLRRWGVSLRHRSGEGRTVPRSRAPSTSSPATTPPGSRARRSTSSRRSPVASGRARS